MVRCESGSIVTDRLAKKSSTLTGIRLISALLVSGGVAGIGLVMWAEATVRIHVAFLGVSMLLFGWSVWVGIDLWKGKSQSYTWAAVLLVLQIPMISFHGFVYQFYVGLILGLSYSRDAASRMNMEFQVGSALNFHLSSETDNLFFGLNLVAIAAVTYLIRKRRELLDSTRQI